MAVSMIVMTVIFHFWSNFHKSPVNSSWHVSERWNCWLTYLSFLFQTDFTTSEKSLNMCRDREELLTKEIFFYIHVLHAMEENLTEYKMNEK